MLNNHELNTTVFRTLESHRFLLNHQFLLRIIILSVYRHPYLKIIYHAHQLQLKIIRLFQNIYIVNNLMKFAFFRWTTKRKVILGIIIGIICLLVILAIILAVVLTRKNSRFLISTSTRRVSHLFHDKSFHISE